MRPRIINAEPEGYSGEARAIIDEFAELHEVKLDRQGLLDRVGEYDGLIVRLGHRIDADVLARASRLQVVATATTGLNHIDVDELQRWGISLICLKGERAFLDTIHATAEHTWALLLALIRKIPAAMEHIKNFGWDRNRFRGDELAGRVFGVIGYGRLGSKVAAYGLAFGMKVFACDPYVAFRPPGVEFTDLDTLLSCSDVVSLHIPCDSTTENLLGAREFDLMKAGCRLVNTSRAEVINEAALLSALQEEKLAGAALDLLHGEYSGDRNWLRGNPLVDYASSHDNLILTPHIGGATWDSMRKTEVFIAKRLRKHFIDVST